MTTPSCEPECNSVAGEGAGVALKWSKYIFTTFLETKCLLPFFEFSFELFTTKSKCEAGAQGPSAEALGAAPLLYAGCSRTRLLSCPSQPCAQRDLPKPALLGAPAQRVAMPRARQLEALRSRQKGTGKARNCQRGHLGPKLSSCQWCVDLGLQHPPECAVPCGTLPPSSSAPIIKSCSAARRKPQELLLATVCVTWRHCAQGTWILGLGSPSPANPRSLGGLETL